MNNFHVGQKVVCIDDVPRPGRPPTRLIKGRVYTIRGLCDSSDSDGDYGVYIEGLRNDFLSRRQCERPYKGWRFRPVIERKTDISVFTKILDDVRAGKLVTCD